jgi:hypothetical protein
MMNKLHAPILLTGILFLTLNIFLIPQTAWAAMSEQQARKMVEATYGVQILKSKRSNFHGKPVYLLTVINPGGNNNTAFQVTHLAVDPETGRLISGFRHRTSGYDYAEGNRARTTGKQPAQVFRQGWNWR